MGDTYRSQPSGINFRSVLRDLLVVNVVALRVRMVLDLLVVQLGGLL